MNCDTCGNDKAYRMQQVGNGPWLCDRCGKVDSVFVPDVYFKSGEISESLGVAFGSKMEKWKYLKDRNLSECGDRSRGERGFTPSVSRETPESRRQTVHEAVQKAVAQMKGYTRSYWR